MARFVLLLVFLALTSSVAEATTVKEVARIRGQGQYILRAAGLVVGLNNTGDSGKELAVARPLAEVLKNSGIALGSPLELQNGKSVALVIVTCTIPEGGARADDKFDVHVSAALGSSSLKGGQLYLTPMRGPYATSEVYAVAQGTVDIENPDEPRSGRVRGGARITKDILNQPITDTFDVIIEPSFAGWAAASQIAIAINARAQPQGPRVAMAIDDRTIRVLIPESDRQDRAGFLADVLSADVNTTLLDLPAQVICNQKTGSIIVTGDVQISPVAITHKDLNVTTTIPAPVPSPQYPLVERDQWMALKTDGKPSEVAKLSDLIKAFKQLDIPVEEQIGILQMLHKTGKLQAKLIVD